MRAASLLRKAFWMHSGTSASVPEEAPMDF